MSEYGPGWADCREVVKHVRASYPRRVNIVLHPPIRRVDGKGDSAWTLVASAEPISGRDDTPIYAQSAWGAGGAHRTITAALHEALCAIVERLAEREANGVKLASF